jgi:hypothetical protein
MITEPDGRKDAKLVRVGEPSSSDPQILGFASSNRNLLDLSCHCDGGRRRTSSKRRIAGADGEPWNKDGRREMRSSNPRNLIW